MSSKNHRSVGKIIKTALKEDIQQGDITSSLCVASDKYVKAILLAKENCVICGLDVLKMVFKTKDKNIKFDFKVKDGSIVKKGKVLGYIYGRARSILGAERVALNFLGLLSGIATHTRKFVDKTKTSRVKIMDTRKTYPGLRILEKYAVRVAGGYNHRMSLDKMILVKDNHLKAQKRGVKIQCLIKKIRKKIPPAMKLEVEVNSLREFKQALIAGPDIIMLDNMRIKTINRAVRLKKDPKIKLEVSGNINLKNVKKIARTGVDMISIGSLTHSVKTVNISLEIL